MERDRPNIGSVISDTAMPVELSVGQFFILSGNEPY